VALEQTDHRQYDPDDRDVAVLVEAVAEGAEHLDERHVAEEAGDDRRDRNHQQRVEAQREADDDQRDSQERPATDHSPFLPSPPRCAPSPPEPRRIAKPSSRTGSRVSRISGSVRRLLVMWVCTALVPSWSGPAPEPPAIVS